MNGMVVAPAQLKVKVPPEETALRSIWRADSVVGQSGLPAASAVVATVEATPASALAQMTAMSANRGIHGILPPKFLWAEG